MVIWAMIDANSQKHGDEAIPEIATATESACPVRATVGNDLTCKTASDCPGAALCRFLFSTIACTDGKCGCAAPPPATTTISNKNLPTATPETMTRLIGWDQAWGLVTWPQCKDVSDLLSGFKIQGQMAQDCHFQVNYKSVQCVMADVSPGQVMCLYTSSDCTGDKYVEFKEGDHNIKWIGGDNGNSPEGMNSWEVKANSCR